MKSNARRLVLGFVCCMLAAAWMPAYAQVALFEAAVPLQDGAAPTLFSVWPSEEHAEGFPEDTALLVQVTPPAAEAYTFLFPSYENGEAELMPLLRFVDMNGDGNLDVEAVFVLGASNLTTTYYLFDPADGRLHYSAELGALSNAMYDAELNVILSQANDGAATQYYSLFDIVDGAPVLVRTAYMDASAQGEAFVLLTNVTSAVTGDVLLDESVPFTEDEAAVWNAQYEHLMQALLDGYGSELAPANP